MQIKKTGKKIFGAKLTSQEKKALDIEIERQLAEFDKNHTKEIDALILLTLHDVFGFGEKRLRRFYDIFDDSINSLIKRYELDDSDKIWISSQKLKEYGIDLDIWEKERRENQ